MTEEQIKEQIRRSIDNGNDIEAKELQMVLTDARQEAMKQGHQYIVEMDILKAFLKREHRYFYKLDSNEKDEELLNKVEILSRRGIDKSEFIKAEDFIKETLNKMEFKSISEAFAYIKPRIKSNIPASNIYSLIYKHKGENQ